MKNLKGNKVALTLALLSWRLVPPFARNSDMHDAVAVVAVPFNCFLEGNHPDKTNFVIARAIKERMIKHVLPFYGQREHVDQLYLVGAELRLHKFDSFNGERVQSQRLIAWQAECIIKRFGRDAKVIVIGMPEHLGRIVALYRYYGLNPVVAPESASVPYDGDLMRPGMQKWCTSRKRFVPYEHFIARLGSIALLWLGKFPKIYESVRT